MLHEPVSRDQVAKVRPFFRGLAGFFLLCTLLAAAGLIFALVTEPFSPSIFIGAAVVIVAGHISGSVFFTGYAPNYLLSAHGPKQRF